MHEIPLEKVAEVAGANDQMIFDDKNGLPPGPYSTRPPLKGSK